MHNDIRKGLKLFITLTYTNVTLCHVGMAYLSQQSFYDIRRNFFSRCILSQRLCCASRNIYFLVVLWLIHALHQHLMEMELLLQAAFGRKFIILTMTASKAILFIKSHYSIYHFCLLANLFSRNDLVFSPYPFAAPLRFASLFFC